MDARPGDDRAAEMTIATGKLAGPYLEKCVKMIQEKYPNIKIRVKVITNNFFGELITVSGLITGTDLKEQLAGLDLGERLLIPCNMLRSGEDIFLDDVSVRELEDALGTEIVVVDENGADLVELGIPFSDPTAEGPVIQEANLRALNAGITTDKIFTFVKELRKDVKVPLVFMTYANVVFSYGVERFVSECRESEIDGLILPDLPFEEKEEFHPLCKQYGIELISMVAPTSEKRIAMIAREAEGFIYIVSSLGVTGMRQEIKTDLSSIVKAVRENTKIPCAVGFGISTPQQAKKMAEYADGVIVGSAIIKLLEQYGENAPQHIGAYVREIKSAL